MEAESTKAILGLQLPTDPRWVKLAEMTIEEILVDHAYCEQKAASSCISLIILYPEKDEMVKTLSPIVTEEWGHFRMVLQELEKRGYSFGYPRKDEYVIQLSKQLKKGGTRDEQLMEKLLMNALIEARSCERFRMLSKEINDEGLKQFYHDLMIAEANHYMVFVNLAKLYVDEEVVKRRLDELLKAEAEIIESLDIRGDRMH